VILVTLFMAIPIVSLTSPVSAKGVSRIFFLLPFCYIGSVVLFCVGNLVTFVECFKCL